MQTESFSGDRERETLASVIYNDTVIAATSVAYRQRPDLFHSTVANRVLQYAMDCYDAYRRAPGDDIVGLITLEREKNPGFASQIAQLLSSITPPSTTNSEMLADNAAAYYERVHLEKTVDILSARIKAGQVEECYDQMNRFHRLSTGLTYGVNPIVDKEAVEKAFLDDTGSSILDFGDPDANEFFGDTFSRSSFVVFNASEKSGKSQILLDLALRAVSQDRSVAYFEAGDMSQNQVMKRIYQRLAEHPRRAGSIEIPDTLSVVRERSADGTWEQEIDVHYTHRNYPNDLTAEVALAARENWLDLFSEERTNWRFSAHSGNLSVPDIYAHLDEWERVHGFIPDFIIIDYADLLVPAVRGMEFRHQINDTFARLRGLSLAKKCCLITATQGNAAAWKETVMTRENLSEDKRKAAHPTAILGISASEVEREKQVAKLNYLVRRDDICNESDFLYVGQCLAICAPMVCFYYPNARAHKDGRTTAEKILNSKPQINPKPSVRRPSLGIKKTINQPIPLKNVPPQKEVSTMSEDKGLDPSDPFSVLDFAPEVYALEYAKEEAE